MDRPARPCHSLAGAYAIHATRWGTNPSGRDFHCHLSDVPCPQVVRSLPVRMSISESDLVRITRAIPASRVHRCRARTFAHPAEGDLATVVFKYPTTGINPQLLMVECTQADGGRRWLADVYAFELEVAHGATMAA